ncbi:MAG TPA: hypothetical protein VHB50_06465 [Bryobacteraceae bacterium]|nr:hypothetical protein [Bryobacteraceae bacterium]
MHNPIPLSPELLELLQNTDTCTISNAIETFNVRMRNEGYIQNGMRCIFPDLPPVVGYAVPGRIRTGAPPIADLCYYQRTDFWEYLADFPSPKIMAFADVDHAPGTGAFVGEIHAEIAAAMGCVGYISNGAVRDVPALARKKFQCFAGSVSVSHSYAHIVDFGEPIHLGCLKISPGDLLHCDQHGVLSIPREVVDGLPEAVRAVREREAQLIRLCRSADFSVEKLVALLENKDSCSTQNRT